MNFYLADCTNTLIREIGYPEMKRRDVAKTYALAIKAHTEDGAAVDWARVNAAITERWSRSGLEWIKRQASSGKYWEGVAP